jgi:hypothetical protein
VITRVSSRLESTGSKQNQANGREMEPGFTSCLFVSIRGSNPSWPAERAISGHSSTERTEWTRNPQNPIRVLVSIRGSDLLWPAERATGGHPSTERTE